MFHQLLVLSGYFARLLRSRADPCSTCRSNTPPHDRPCGLEGEQNLALKTDCNRPE
jgi:hypothetical protein